MHEGDRSEKSTTGDPSVNHNFTRKQFERFFEQERIEKAQQAEFVRTHETPRAEDISNVDPSSLYPSTSLTRQLMSEFQKNQTLDQITEAIKVLNRAQKASYQATGKSTPEVPDKDIDRTSAAKPKVVEEVQKANPGHKNYWIELGYEEGQAQRNAEAAGEFLRQAQRNTKEAREFLQQIKKSKVFWASFGAMKEQDDRIVDEKWRTPTSEIVKKALGELNRFNREFNRFNREFSKPSRFIASQKEFSEDFVKERKLYGFEYSFRVASDLASERQDAENERLKRKKEPPKEKNLERQTWGEAS